MPFVPDKAPPRGRFVPDAPIDTPAPSMGGLYNPLALSMLGRAKRAEQDLPQNVNDIDSPVKMAAAVPDAAAGLATGLGTTVAGGLAGLVSSPFIGSERSSQLVEKIQGSAYQPRTLQGQILARGVSLPAEGLGFLGNKLGEKTTDVTGSPLLGAAANTGFQALPVMLGARPGKTPRGNYKPAAETVPTKEALKQASTEAYKRSESIGAVVNEGRFSSFQRDLADVMQKSGIDSTLHPDATAALKRIAEEKGPMTLEKIETLRRIAQDAEGSIKPADAKKAGDMVDAIDTMVENLKPEDLAAGTPEAAAALKEARGLWSRARKADIIDEMMRRAELSAPNFSASGMENAIRTEFRALAKNERRFKRFTKEEQEAITRVAQGGPLENTLRFLGKAAPTGVVSTTLGTGLGFLAGGPAGAAAVPAIGGLSRLGARQLTTRNANAVNELVRRGPLGDNFLSETPLRQNTVGSNLASSVPAPAARFGTPARPVPLYESPDLRAINARSGPVQQDAGQTGGAPKSINDLYLEALIEELRKRGN
jgi:hypothetical protein